MDGTSLQIHPKWTIPSFLIVICFIFFRIISFIILHRFTQTQLSPLDFIHYYAPITLR